jgi:hypothetical protein
MECFELQDVSPEFPLNKDEKVHTGQGFGMWMDEILKEENGLLKDESGAER